VQESLRVVVDAATLALAAIAPDYIPLGDSCGNAAASSARQHSDAKADKLGHERTRASCQRL
jgi:hypothetical protein